MAERSSSGGGGGGGGGAGQPHTLGRQSVARQSTYLMMSFLAVVLLGLPYIYVQANLLITKGWLATTVSADASAMSARALATVDYTVSRLKEATYSIFEHDDDDSDDQEGSTHESANAREEEPSTRQDEKEEQEEQEEQEEGDEMTETENAEDESERVVTFEEATRQRTATWDLASAANAAAARATTQAASSALPRTTPRKPASTPSYSAPAKGGSSGCVPKSYADQPAKRTRSAFPCKCGNETCAHLDSPSVSYVMPRASSRDMLRKAFLHAARESASSPAGFEVLVSLGIGAGTVSVDEAMEEARATLPPSYRDEALERVVLLRTNANRNVAEKGLVRMANGQSVVILGGGDGGNDVASAPPRERRDAVSDAEADCAFDVAFALQYFKRPPNIVAIASRLKKYPRAQILINDDSNTEDEQWQASLRGAASYSIVHSGNIHEIRAYNRLVKLASARYVVLLQDDDRPPASTLWIRKAYAAFDKFPKLALLGALSGQIQGGPDSGKYGHRQRGAPRPLSYRYAGIPFMFVTLVNMGPFVMKRTVFLESGMFQLDFSCRGAAGIGFDFEYAVRMWYTGRQVALFKPPFEYHVGDWAKTGTRANPAAYRMREATEKRNSASIEDMYKPFYRNHGRANSPEAKRMSFARICKAAQLPTRANKAQL
ncbi:hypothetical protein PPROV_000581500 [Pycnococcus provasolii]|uniref:Uncharacterized protein n=1 Tax=Pycnococcus provasolii TaxID=41880 RepID=A0A830HJM5_9CHLO|nr:hypothetical protein PPROV_000581500 [Pycnococcus provasolii]